MLAPAEQHGSHTLSRAAFTRSLSAVNRSVMWASSASIRGSSTRASTTGIDAPMYVHAKSISDATTQARSSGTTSSPTDLATERRNPRPGQGSPARAGTNGWGRVRAPVPLDRPDRRSPPRRRTSTGRASTSRRAASRPTLVAPMPAANRLQGRARRRSGGAPEFRAHG